MFSFFHHYRDSLASCSPTSLLFFFTIWVEPREGDEGGRNLRWKLKIMLLKTGPSTRLKRRAETKSGDIIHQSDFSFFHPLLRLALVSGKPSRWRFRLQNSSNPKQSNNLIRLITIPFNLFVDSRSFREKRDKTTLGLKRMFCDGVCNSKPTPKQL